LLTAWCDLHETTPLSGTATSAQTFPEAPSKLAIDDAQCLEEAHQRALFGQLNRARMGECVLLVSLDRNPRALNFTPDLTSRLNQGLTFELHALSDAAKSAALERHATQRGLKLPDEVTRYMLTHLKRDMPTLMRMIDALDEESLSRKRAVTLPLLRELLNRTQELPLQEAS
jgi:DnaA-homolog protein